MAAKIGISGFGRISRVAIRAAIGDPDIKTTQIGRASCRERV